MNNIKLCEVCGKEHDGSYGSGRFCCYNCKQKYASIRGTSASIQYTKEKQGIKCTCEFCNKQFLSKADLKKHLINCSKRIKYRSEKHGKWTCNYCNLVFETRRKLQQHNKQVHPVLDGCKNQFTRAKLLGLEKPTVSKETRQKIGLAHKGLKHSDESKKKTSETMKRKIEEGSFVVPYKRNHSSKVSYPEKYFMEVFKELPIEYNYQVGLYQLDFAIPVKKVYVEIDGEQHYVDRTIVEHDKKRTEKLNALGWICLRRIRWSEYQKLSQNEKADYCNELVNELRNL